MQDQYRHIRSIMERIPNDKHGTGQRTGKIFVCPCRNLLFLSLSQILETDSKRIPIIALTANAFDEDVQRSLQAGMNAHLTKPVDPEHLYQTLGELIYEAGEKEAME